MPSCGIAICNTISAQRRKNEVIGNDCQAKRPPARSTQSQVPGISTYFCTPFYSIDIYIFFFCIFLHFLPGLHNAKCLASLDFLFLGICCFARTTWQHFLLVSNNPRTVSIIKRQRIKLRALLFLASPFLPVDTSRVIRCDTGLFVEKFVGFLGSNWICENSIW